MSIGHNAITMLPSDAGGGGGSGQATQYRFKSFPFPIHTGNNYMICRTFYNDGSDHEGNSDVQIALPFPLRAAQCPGSLTDYEFFPAYTTNGLVYAMDVDHSGVTVSGVEITKVEINSARNWAAYRYFLDKNNACAPMKQLVVGALAVSDT